LFHQVINVYKSFQIEATELRGFGLHFKRNEPDSLEAGQTTLTFPLRIESQSHEGANLTPEVGSKRNDTPPRHKRVRTLLSPSMREQMLKRFKAEFGLHPNEIDDTVIPFLPDDMKKELELIQSDVKSPERRVASSSGERHIANNNTKSSRHSAVSLKSRRYNLLECGAPELAGESDPSVIREWLDSWTSRNNLNSDPLDEDVNLVEHYLLGLIPAMELEMCSSLLDFLTMRIRGKLCNNFKWKEALSRIMASVNREVIAQYGSHLKLREL
jgi:DNA repair protein REV1 C-terminal domain